MKRKARFQSLPKPHRPHPAFLLDLHSSGVVQVFHRLSFFRLFQASPLDPRPLPRVPAVRPPVSVGLDN